jgi:hypothetical protein
MRVVHSDNMMIRRFGKTKVATGRKLFNGMIRNNWKVCEYSERDIATFTAPFNIKPLGIRAANRHFIETCDNFRPDVILLGHSDLITNHTLKQIKKLMPDVPLIYRNVDPLWRERNVDVINWRKEVVDSIFVTTSGGPLEQFSTPSNTVGYIPNATDPAVENMDNSLKTSFDRDLMYCGKGAKSDDRYPLVVHLHEALQDQLKFETYGIYGHPPVWSHDYDQVLATSKMGLNLNRFEDWPWYSSARISQLMGNGLLAFIWDQGDMRHFFTDEHVAFFKDEKELIQKTIAFQHDDAHRQAVASAGRAFYHEHFSGQRIVQFMVETTLNQPYSHDYIWQREVYR